MKSNFNKKRKVIYAILFLLILVDIGYSFKQHYAKTLDGDIAGGVIPAEDVKPVLNNPLGIVAIYENKTYTNPNRFFCHWFFREYLLKVPLGLQYFTSPITSVYLACAIAKSLTQTGLILLLSMLITGSSKVFKLDFIITVFLITAVFQTNGFFKNIGIIDHSTTYLFFYGLPAAILLLYLLPFINQFYHKKTTKISFLLKILWIPLAFIVCLSGPLNPGAILVFSLLVILAKLKKNFSYLSQQKLSLRIINTVKLIPTGYWFYLTPVVLLSLYSLFIGKYNSITINTQIPLLEMYKKLPNGIYETFLKGYGYTILLLLLILNSAFIKFKLNNKEGKKILRIISWISIFSIIYICLLPLGGYRDYRPFIIRYDTIIPITLGFIFAYGLSTLFIIKNSSINQKKWYLPLLLCFIIFYTQNDHERFDHNKCEITAINKIVYSEKKIVELNCDCNVLSWDLISNPEETRLNSKLLMHWNIIKKEKLYYHSK